MLKLSPNIFSVKPFPVKRIYLTIFLLTVVSAAYAQSPILQFDVSQPRAFGYYLGDKFERVVKLSLTEPYKLDRDSLPKAGYLRPWLRVEKPVVQQNPIQHGTSYEIKLVYQIVNIDPEHLNIGVAHHDIQIHSPGDNQGDGERYNILIPATRVSAALITTKPGEDLQADTAPVRAAVNIKHSLIYACLLAVGVLGVYLLTFGWSFARPRQPFSRIHQRFKRQSSAAWNEGTYRDALKETHGAFNELAGRTIFHDDIDDFVAEHPGFKHLTPKINAFFAHTRNYFFAKSGGDAAAFPTAELISFLAECTRAEKSVD